MPSSEPGILVRPGREHLPDYIAALKRGWSPNTTRDVSGQELAEIEADPAAFLAALDDPEAKASDVQLPDGTTVKRLPSFRRFIWDGEFCGIVNLRWQNGTTALPAYCLGHVGYAVVPWKQRRGYATGALAAILPEARKIGLTHLEISTDAENEPSQKVIFNNGGTLLREFQKPKTYAAGTGRLYKIEL